MRVILCLRLRRAYVVRESSATDSATSRTIKSVAEQESEGGSCEAYANRETGGRQERAVAAEEEEKREALACSRLVAAVTTCEGGFTLRTWYIISAFCRAGVRYEQDVAWIT